MPSIGSAARVLLAADRPHFLPIFPARAPGFKSVNSRLVAGGTNPIAYPNLIQDGFSGSRNQGRNARDGRTSRNNHQELPFF